MGTDLNINLMEKFGAKYQVQFDMLSFKSDKKTKKCSQCKYRNASNQCHGKCLVSTQRDWYYSIPCKYGAVSLYGDQQLHLYCNSGRISRRILAEMKEKVICNALGENDSLIRFDFKFIREIFKYVKPRSKRIISKEHLRKLQKGRLKHLSQKEENASQKRF